MKFILFEVYYRIFYTIGAITIIECFSYFILGHQLEFFSGLLAFNYQAVDFDSYGDLKRICQSLPKDLKQEDCFLLFEDKQGQAEIHENEVLKPLVLSCSESCGLERQPRYFLALSPNEGRAWFYLFIVYLGYFYCLEVDKTTLSSMVMYIKLIYFCILTITQIYSVAIPGLLKKWAGNFFFLSVAFTVILLFSESAMFILTASFEELQLEQLDSELL